MSRRFLRVGVAIIACLVSLAPATGAATGANVRVTRDATPHSYARADGGTDPTMDSCSTNRRAQNEPAVAVDPHNPSVVTAGSNDYCAAVVNGDVWAGFYRSTNGGASWQDNLVPGHPHHTPAARLASPTHRARGGGGGPPPTLYRGGGR